MDKSIQERILAKTEKTYSCWIWKGALDTKGYGTMKINRKQVKAHRLAYATFIGDIPKGEGYHGTIVMHLCDNPRCVNPAHLQLGTAKDNAHDRDRKKRTCKPQGEKHGSARLSESDIIAIRHDTRKQREIALDYGVSAGHIGLIKRQRRWGHI